VRRDVVEGLGQFFRVDDVTFVAPTTPEDGLFTNPAGSYAVAWRCTCTDDKVFPDLVPSYRTFQLDGVSMVSRVDGEWEYRRLIDWNAAVCALGESRHRRSVRADGARSYFESQVPGR
jgi:hypothetical protein